MENFKLDLGWKKEKMCFACSIDFYRALYLVAYRTQFLTRNWWNYDSDEHFHIDFTPFV